MLGFNFPYITSAHEKWEGHHPTLILTILQPSQCCYC